MSTGAIHADWHPNGCNPGVTDGACHLMLYDWVVAIRAALANWLFRPRWEELF
jgi:hypothetical protein